jgi:hypothetical protein
VLSKTVIFGDVPGARKGLASALAIMLSETSAFHFFGRPDQLRYGYRELESRRSFYHAVGVFLRETPHLLEQLSQYLRLTSVGVPRNSVKAAETVECLP